MNKYVKYFNVAGVTFEGRQEVISELIGDEVIYLKAEPDNKYDPNALAVWVTYPLEASQVDMCVGYVPKDRATEFHLMMKQPDFTCELADRVGGFSIDFDRVAPYGLVIKCEASYDRAHN